MTCICSPCRCLVFRLQQIITLQLGLLPGSLTSGGGLQKIKAPQPSGACPVLGISVCAHLCFSNASSAVLNNMHCKRSQRSVPKLLDSLCLFKLFKLAQLRLVMRALKIGMIKAAVRNLKDQLHWPTNTDKMTATCLYPACRCGHFTLVLLHQCLFASVRRSLQWSNQHCNHIVRWQREKSSFGWWGQKPHCYFYWGHLIKVIKLNKRTSRRLRSADATPKD